jgi:hypothetical protein
MTTTTSVPTAGATGSRSIRTRLLAGIAGLAVIQLVHLLDVLRYVEEASFPGVLADPLAAVGIGVAVIALATLLLRRKSARTWTIVASVSVALGFVLHHGIPVELGTNNPYWTFDDGNRADAFRWATVIALIALGAWTAVTAWRTTSTELDAG